MILWFFQKFFLEFQRFFHFAIYSECIVCESGIKKNQIFCQKCFLSLNFITFSCKKCGDPTNGLFSQYDIKTCLNCLNPQNKKNKYIDSAQSLFVYEDESDLMKIIFRIKNQDHQYVFDQISKLLILYFGNYICKFDMIASVPSHFSKFFRKGFNTSELLASSLLENLKFSHGEKNFSKACRILKKIKGNKQQRGLNFLNRIENNKGVFAFNERFFSKEEVLNKKILLIDDVFTSGSTLNECAKILKKQAGVMTVGVLTLGKTFL